MDRTIRVKDQTYQRLCKHGDLSSSFDSTISRLIDSYEQGAHKQ